MKKKSINMKEEILKKINAVITKNYDNYVSYANINLPKAYRTTKNSHIDLVHDVIADITTRSIKSPENMFKFNSMLDNNQFHFYVMNSIISNCKIVTFPFLREIIKARQTIEYRDEFKSTEDILDEQEVENDKVTRVNQIMRNISAEFDKIDILMFKMYMFNNVTYKEVGETFNLNKSQAFTKINNIRLKIKSCYDEKYH
jgi:hypothetical protein